MKENLKDVKAAIEICHGVNDEQEKRIVYALTNCPVSFHYLPNGWVSGVLIK